MGIRSAAELFDTTTPYGKFTFQLLGSLAELDRASNLERMTLGRDRVAQDGKWTGGTLPLGYDLDADGRLIVSSHWVPEVTMSEEDLVRDLFTRIAQGSTTYQECLRLKVPSGRRYRDGHIVENPHGWVPERLRFLLRNPVYIGQHVVKSKRGMITRDVPALVDASTWERVQAQLTANKRKPKANATRTYLLRGLITCGKCGYRYAGTVHHGVGKTAYYRCKSRNGIQWRACPSKMLNAAEIENQVWQDCRQFILNPGEALVEA